MNELHISLYRGSSGETITVEEYLAINSTQRATVAADLDHVTISLKSGGQERLAHQLSLGPLERLVPQFELALRRLQANKFALIRSGVLDIPDGHYLLFKPRQAAPDGRANCDQVSVSLITIDELPISGWFPDEQWAEWLYQYVGMYRERLVATASLRLDSFHDLLYDRAALLTLLAQEASASRTLMSQMGRSQVLSGPSGFLTLGGVPFPSFPSEAQPEVSALRARAVPLPLAHAHVGL